MKRKYNKKKKQEEESKFLDSQLPLPSVNKDIKYTNKQVVLNKNKLMHGTRDEKKEQISTLFENSDKGLTITREIRNGFNESTNVKDIIWWLHITASLLHKNNMVKVQTRT